MNIQHDRTAEDAMRGACMYCDTSAGHVIQHLPSFTSDSRTRRDLGETSDI